MKSLVQYINEAKLNVEQLLTVIKKTVKSNKGNITLEYDGKSFKTNKTETIELNNDGYTRHVGERNEVYNDWEIAKPEDIKIIHYCLYNEHYIGH